MAATSARISHRLVFRTSGRKISNFGNEFGPPKTPLLQDLVILVASIRRLLRVNAVVGQAFERGESSRGPLSTTVNVAARQRLTRDAEYLLSRSMSGTVHSPDLDCDPFALLALNRDLRL